MDSFIILILYILILGISFKIGYKNKKNNPKEVKNEKNQWPFYYWFLWSIALLLVILAIFFDLIPFKTVNELLLLFLLIGLVLLPLLNKFKIGNLFEMDLKNISQSVDELKDTVLNLSLNMKNEQSTVLNFNPPNISEKALMGATSISENKTELKQTNSLQYLFNQAITHLNRKEFLSAIESLKKILELDCKNWRSAMMLGFIYLSLDEIVDDIESLGLSKGNAINNSIKYSGIAIELDKSHYNQYMNLALALKKSESRFLLEEGLENLKKAKEVFNRDPNTMRNPNLCMENGKVTSFMGEFSEILGNKKNALKYRNEAMDIFDSCPDPKPTAFKKWYEDTKNAVIKLNSD